MAGGEGGRLLAACWGVFLTQYANVAMLAAFFPDSVVGRKIGSAMVGATFAAYPLATAAAARALRLRFIAAYFAQASCC